MASTSSTHPWPDPQLQNPMSHTQENKKKMSPALLSMLLSSKIDGRTENVRYRQDQLQKLHTGLVKHGVELRRALQQDTGYSTIETNIEYAMALKTLRHHYENLNFESALVDEYRVKNGLDAADRKIGSGVVLINCSKRFPFFSLISPLSAAIAAGNVVLVKLEQDLRHLPTRIRSVMSLLDPDTFQVTSEAVSDENFLSQAILIDQTTNASKVTSASLRTLRGPPSSRVIAVVDRTADLGLAASTLTSARFGFRGQSIYAPDLVLVNEFVLEDFLEAIARNIVAYTADSEGHQPSSTTDTFQTLLKQIEADRTAKINFQAKNGTAVQLSSRQSRLIKAEVDGPVLLIASTSSLEDMVTFTNSLSSSSHRFIASFIFASLSSAKYLSQFIDADASFINHIPPELLVGPAAPSSLWHGISIQNRYEPSMFQICRPHFVSGVTNSKSRSILLQANVGGNVSGKEKKRLITQQLLNDATRDLHPTGQALQMRGIGFFEQGIFVGLAMAAIPLLTALGFGSYFGGRYVYRHWF